MVGLLRLLLRRNWFNMVIYDEGINRMVALLESDVSNVEFYVDGSGVSVTPGTPPATTADYDDTSPTSTTSSKLFQVTGVIPSTSGNGSTFDTALVFVNSGANAITGFEFTDISKTANKQVTVIQTVVVNQA